MFHRIGVDFSDMCVAVELVRVTGSFIQTVFGIFADSRFQFFRHLEQLGLTFFLAAGLLNFFLESHDTLDFLMTIKDGIEDNVFRQFVGTSLHHHYGIFRAGNGEVQGADFTLFFRGIDDEFIIYTAYAHTGNRAHKGNIGNAECCRGTNHGSQFRRVILFYGHNRSNNLHVIAVAFREQRTNRTVNQTGAKDSVARRTALTFDKTAGNLTGSIHFFFIIYGQREEIHAFTGFRRSRCRYQHDRITIADKGCAVGLFRQFAGFNRQLAAAQFHFKTMHNSPPTSNSYIYIVRHLLFLSCHQGNIQEKSGKSPAFLRKSRY